MTTDTANALPIITLPGPTQPTEHLTPTLQALLAVGVEVAEAKAGLAVALYEEQRARVAFERAQVGHEKSVIDAAGGEKALGPNEAAQKRALADLIEQFPSFVAARDAYHDAQLDRRLAETDVTFAESQHAALLAALQAKVFHVPTDWLYLPGEDRPTPAVAVAPVQVAVATGSVATGAVVTPQNGHGHHPA